jgi:hypothetical protein
MSLKFFIFLRNFQFRDKVLNYVDSANISNDEGWIMFNVTDPMITWVTFPHHNLGLYLRIRANQIGIQYLLYY